MTGISESDHLLLQLIVTGAHLSQSFGNTYQQIIADGFTIDYKVDMEVSSDSAIAISRSMGLGMAGFAEAFSVLQPDLLVILGDRYELISIASAANIAGIPIAHLHGGEITEGSKDDTFRHAITKLSHLHFASMPEYAQRIIQMGENPARVFHTGAIGLDFIEKDASMTQSDLYAKFGIKFQPRNLLITYHPDTISDCATSSIEFSRRAFGNLLELLSHQRNTLLIFTKANADLGGELINRMIDDFVDLYPEFSLAFDSLGRTAYLSCLKYVDGLVGNSSSGIYEAASFKLGVINIGDRQKGRFRGENLIDVAAEPGGLAHALETLYSAEFKAKMTTLKNPYGQGNACEKIINVLETCDLECLNKKIFFDVTSAPI